MRKTWRRPFAHTESPAKHQRRNILAITHTITTISNIVYATIQMRSCISTEDSPRKGLLLVQLPYVRRLHRAR
ncbi:hypothetical protein JB92DRAFT_2889508 [Gautieria morchelliformis]|nr:hypothetical protein JB92DRAFT_2889508 [Gautieria morchelliformis]